MLLLIKVLIAVDYSYSECSALVLYHVSHNYQLSIINFQLLYVLVIDASHHHMKYPCTRFLSRLPWHVYNSSTFIHSNRSRSLQFQRNLLFYKPFVIHFITIWRCKDTKFPRFSIKNSQDFQFQPLYFQKIRVPRECHGEGQWQGCQRDRSMTSLFIQEQQETIAVQHLWTQQWLDTFLSVSSHNCYYSLINN